MPNVLQDKSYNILIVCFSFPPFPGIGGRRWVKFAKILSKKGYNIHTLSARNESENESEWKRDIQNFKSYTIPLGFSKVLSFPPATFTKKVIYKFLSKIAPVLIKGNSQDKVFFIKKDLLSTAQNIIKEHNISTVIVSIPPYKLAYYLLSLKKTFPSLKFIVDYRDPWTDNKSYHGFANISDSRLKEELNYETEVLSAYDTVLDVNKESLELLKLKSQNKTKFHHLPNGFDPDDYITEGKISSKKDDKIRFIYSGSFYPNLTYLLEPLIKCITNIKIHDSELFLRLEFNFYGNLDHYAKACIDNCKLENIKYHGNISQKDIVKAINDSDYCMLYSAVDHGAAFNTKFYEYLYLRKPIVYFGPNGKLSDYILNNSVGLVLTPEALNSSKNNVLADLVKANHSFNVTLDLSNFNIEVICEKLIDIINSDGHES